MMIWITNQPSQALSRLFLGEAAMVTLKFSHEQAVDCFVVLDRRSGMNGTEVCWLRTQQI